MEIYNQGNVQVNNKKTVYLDVDDVLLFSTEQIISMFNKQRKKEGLDELTKDKDFRDYSFKSFRKGIQFKQKINEMYDSDEFFENVKFNEEFINRLERNNEQVFNAFNWVLVTKGSKINHIKKSRLIFNHPFFKRHINEVAYYGLTMKEEKRSVYMMDGIQVDDMIENLENTDAIVKILFKNDSDTEQNRINKLRIGLGNLYVINTPSELVDTFEFLANCEAGKLGFDFFEGLEVE